MDDDDFEPRLGRIGHRRAKGGRSFLRRVLAAAALYGAARGSGRRPFVGSRIGRGASMARALSTRDRYSGLRARRVIVKVRLVRLGGKGLAGAKTHLKYIQRDGVTREGEPGRLYDARDDVVDGREFVQRGDGDRHQFRFIVSAEDASEYPDLKPLVRKFMAQVEKDLETRLDWVAVDHFNTAFPHTHIVLRGTDEGGSDLVIAPEYISHGLRARVTELVNRDLGPRTDLEIEARLRHDVDQERLTPIDRILVRDADDDHVVSASAQKPFEQSMRAGRLQKLGRLGLADHLGSGTWRLADNLEDVLRRMGERSDIIRTMQREMRARMPERSISEALIYDPSVEGAAPLVGRVISRGLSDEVRDRHYLLVDGIDGHVHHIDIGRGDAVEGLPQNAIVRITPADAAPRAADRTIAEVAAAHGGQYSVALHLSHDPSASERFALAHIRRLEAMRRATGLPERAAGGVWKIHPDYLVQVERNTAIAARDRPISCEILSRSSLSELLAYDGPTWLDWDAAAAARALVRESGFGEDVLKASRARQLWLIDQGLAVFEGGSVIYAPDFVETLRRRELLRVSQQLARELNLPFAELEKGNSLGGRLVKRVDLPGGRYGVVENGREFSLVPWRPSLERQIGRDVAGVVRDRGFDWSITRGRSGPTIS